MGRIGAPLDSMTLRAALPPEPELNYWVSLIRFVLNSSADESRGRLGRIEDIYST